MASVLSCSAGCVASRDAARVARRAANQPVGYARPRRRARGLPNTAASAGAHESLRRRRPRTAAAAGMRARLNPSPSATPIGPHCTTVLSQVPCHIHVVEKPRNRRVGSWSASPAHVSVNGSVHPLIVCGEQWFQVGISHNLAEPVPLGPAQAYCQWVLCRPSAGEAAGSSTAAHRGATG